MKADVSAYLKPKLIRTSSTKKRNPRERRRGTTWPRTQNRVKGMTAHIFKISSWQKTWTKINFTDISADRGRKFSGDSM